MARRPHPTTVAALIACLANASPARGSPSGDDPPPLRLQLTLRLESLAADRAMREEPPESLLSAVRLNGLDRGEFSVLKIGATYYLQDGDLPRLGIDPVLVTGLPRRRIGSADWLSLAALGARKVEFDERNLVLSAELPVALLPRQRIELKMLGSPHALSNAANRSAFLNYQWSLGRSADTASATSLRLTTELGVHTPFGLFRSYQASIRETAGGPGHQGMQNLRYATQWIFDDRERLIRWTAGDFQAAGGTFGGAASLGGVSVERIFGMDPRFVRNPLARLTAQTATPAEVTVSYRGLPLLRQTVNPGTIDIRDLYMTSGARDLDVAVRDAFGRVERFTLPFYFSDELLRKGLTEFSLQAGSIRRSPEGKPDGYDGYAAFGMWRGGIDDHLTVGARAEADNVVANAGVSAQLRLDRFGVFGWHGSYGGARHPRAFGTAMQFSHSYQSIDTGMQVSVQNVGRNYRTVNGGPLQEDAQRLLRQTQIDLFHAFPHIGIVSFGATRGQRASSSRFSEYSVSWSRTVAKGLTLLAGYRRSTDPVHRSEGYLTLSWNLDTALNANAGLRAQDRGDRQLGLSYSRSVPLGSGLGYRLDADAGRNEGIDGKTLRGFAQYNFERTSLAGEVRQIHAGGSGSRAYNLDWAGALAWVDGRFGLSRAIPDSFALIALAEPLANVRVYQNGQPIGHTDARGQLVLPTLSAYQTNNIVLEHKDIPFDYTFGDMQSTIVPKYRSGHLWRLEVYRAQAYAGKLRFRQGGRLIPVVPGEGSIEHNGKQVIFLIGNDGDFFLERLQAGKYRGSVRIDGKDCGFSVTLPASAELLINIGEVVACE